MREGVALVTLFVSEESFTIHQIGSMEFEFLRERSAEERCQHFSNGAMRVPPFLVCNVNAANSKNGLLRVGQVGSSATGLIRVEKVHQPAPRGKSPIPETLKA